MNLNLNEIWHKTGYLILNLRHQGLNQKIMCYDSKDNNNTRFQLFIKIVYPFMCVTTQTSSQQGLITDRNLCCQLSTITNQNICLS